jgi:hypothetical protein
VAPNFFQVSYIFTGLISGEKKGFFHLNNTIEKYIFFYLLFLHYISLKSPKLDDYFANNTHRPTYHCLEESQDTMKFSQDRQLYISITKQ